MPVISVIVPVYKVEDYLKPCIDSILAQSFSDFELILVDDGSPDQCGEICDEYAANDNRITVIHKKNGGLSDARNKGIDIAKGEYLAFVDSDDLIHKEFLMSLYNLLIKNNADIVCCKYETFKNNKTPSLDSPVNCWQSTLELTGKEACKNYYSMTGQITIEAWGKLYKKNLFDELRYPYGKINEDNGTTPIALYNSHLVVFTNALLYKYRIRNNSIMSNSFTSKRFDALDCTQMCIDYLVSKNETEIVDQAQICKNVIHAKLIIDAIAQNSKESIPEQYRISEYKALKIIRENSSDDLFCWYLSRIHPNWLRPYLYMNKVRALFRKNQGK